MTTNDIAESDVKVNSDFFETLHLEDIHKPILQEVIQSKRFYFKCRAIYKKSCLQYSAGFIC